MCKLIEFEQVRQIPGEPRRRWFTCEDLELLVWCDDSDSPISHKIIDDGEQCPWKHKATPILVEDAPASATFISKRFAQVSAGLPVELAEFVGKKLGEDAAYVTQALTTRRTE